MIGLFFDYILDIFIYYKRRLGVKDGLASTEKITAIYNEMS